MMPAAADIPYRLAWRTRSVRAGAHRSSVAGTGGMFRDLTSLLDARDPRRIDLRQSLRDPFGQVHIRRFEQTSAIVISMLVDVSASMTFAGRTRKQALAAELASVIARSAIRTGDKFSLRAADATPNTHLTLHATRSRTAAVRAADALRDFPADGRGSGGLAQAASLIGARRGLVFLVSDFLVPEAELETVFAALSRHDVVPIALYDSAEIDALPSWGLMELADLETGRRRLVMLRPSFKEAWRRRIEARRSDFRRLARRHGREPFEVTDRIDWERLGAHLSAGAR